MKNCNLSFILTDQYSSGFVSLGVISIAPSLLQLVRGCERWFNFKQFGDL